MGLGRMLNGLVAGLSVSAAVFTSCTGNTKWDESQVGNLNMIWAWRQINVKRQARVVLIILIPNLFHLCMKIRFNKS